jgi:hypothetical protein
MLKASNYREHRENRMVGILRRTTIFVELVKRFVAGQSVIRVADWAYEFKPKGLEHASYGTLRVYLSALRARIRQDFVEQSQQNHESSPTPESVQAERIAQAIQMTPMPPHRLDRFEGMVDKRLREVQATDILKVKKRGSVQQRYCDGTDASARAELQSHSNHSKPSVNMIIVSRFVRWGGQRHNWT